MKKILIAAAAVGAAIAGIILYNRNKNNEEPKRIEDAAKDAYDAMNEGIGKVERGTMHSMG